MTIKVLITYPKVLADESNEKRLVPEILCGISAARLSELPIGVQVFVIIKCVRGNAH